MSNPEIKPVLGTQMQLGHPSIKEPLAFWIFNEGNGSRAIDSSLKGNNLTSLVNTSWVSGGLNFNGTNAFATNNMPTTSGVFTWMIWVNARRYDNVAFGPVIMGSNVRYLQILSATNRFLCQVNGVDRIAPPPVSLDTWHLLGTSYDGTTLRLYIDGEVAAEFVITPPNPHFNDMTIGSLRGGTSFFLDGRVGGALISNFAFTTAMFKLLYLNPYVMFEESFNLPVLAPLAGNVGALFNAGLLKGKLQERLFQC